MKANLFEWEQLRPGSVHKITVARLEKRKVVKPQSLRFNQTCPGLALLQLKIKTCPNRAATSGVEK